jgi:hypothetical protein
MQMTDPIYIPDDGSEPSLIACAGAMLVCAIVLVFGILYSIWRLAHP